MDSNTMANELELRLDRSDSFGSPGYEDFELSSVLTEAQESYVKKFVSELNNRKLQGFEETEIRSQGLSALIKRGASLTTSASQADVITNGKFFDLPTDFMYTIYEEAVIDKILCNTVDTPINVGVRPISHDDVSRLKYNKYKKPYYKDYGRGMVWRLVFSRFTDGIDPAVAATDKRHQLVTDGTFNVTGYSMNYLKNPDNIVVDRTTPANRQNCILDESTHNTIIDIAVDLMMNRVKEQKLQNIEGLKDLE